MEEKQKIIIVDDRRFARGFFAATIERNPQYALIKQLPSAADAVGFCAANDVDLVVMDVMMRYGMDGMTAAERIKEIKPSVKIILTTAAAESNWMPKARALGVESFWYQEYSDEKLSDIIRRTLAGESVYPAKAPDLPFGDTTKSALTDRELDVLRELTAGYSNHEIAEKLQISVNTVRTHIVNMVNKTGYESRFDLALNAKALGVVVADRKGE